MLTCCEDREWPLPAEPLQKERHLSLGQQKEVGGLGRCVGMPFIAQFHLFTARQRQRTGTWPGILSLLPVKNTVWDFQPEMKGAA